MAIFCANNTRGERLLIGAVICAGVMVAVAAAADSAPAAKKKEVVVASVVVGFAQCANCSGKNEAVFKGLQVAIKCKNGAGGYEQTAVGELDAAAGTFAVRLPVDLGGGTAAATDCVAQLRSAASGVPCPRQEPSKILPVSDGTFVAAAGKVHAHYPSPAECAAANICFPCRGKKHLLLFERKPFFMHRRMKPLPEFQDQPPATPEYGEPMPRQSPCPPPAAPEYGTPAAALPRCRCYPTPEPGCQCPPPTTPEYGTPLPEYPPPAPEYGTPAPARCRCYPTPEPGCQCAPPTPEYGSPLPEYPPPAPEYGTPAPPRCRCSSPAPTPPEYGTPLPENPPPAPVYGTPAPRRCHCSAAPAYGTPGPEYAPVAPAYGTPAPGCATHNTPAPVYGQPAAECPPSAPEYGTTPECPPIYSPPAKH